MFVEEAIFLLLHNIYWADSVDFQSSDSEPFESTFRVSLK